MLIIGVEIFPVQEIVQTINKKKWQAYYIAPLQPPTLAVFRPWGSSAGAGRVRPAGAKIRKQDKSEKMNS